MWTKITIIRAASILSFLLLTRFLHSQECTPGEDIDFKAADGVVTIIGNGKKYPVPVPEVIPKLNCTILGIGPMFSHQIALNDDEMEKILTRKITKFYQGRKVLKAQMPKFSRQEIIPEHFALRSRMCKGKKGVTIELDTEFCEIKDAKNSKCLVLKIFPQCM